MRVRRFRWEGAAQTAAGIREWSQESAPDVDVGPIERDVRERGDEALRALTARFDATERAPESLRVAAEDIEGALEALDPELRESLELAAANVRAVAEAQIDDAPLERELPQGQSVTLRETPVGAAAIYAPGGRAAYPSSVLMGAIPARVAGVQRVALASPPGPDGSLNPVTLAAAALCEVDEVHAIGGAQAIFALAYGTETIDPVDAIAGPGNAWVREAKRAVYGTVAIDSLAGPSELMVVTGPETDPEWAALDLCAQAEHGAEGPLVATAESDEALERLQAAVERAAAERPGVGDAPLALVLPPGFPEAIELANAFAPEHLQLFDADAAALVDRVTTAGCVFAGPHSATAFGDYAAGSNHVLPTGGAGRFSGPLGPGVFRRKIATVEVPPEAAAKLAPHVDTIARAEGFPVHGESAMIRAKDGDRSE
jgi:histidinol dehydrogenase